MSAIITIALLALSVSVSGQSSAVSGSATVTSALPSTGSSTASATIPVISGTSPRPLVEYRFTYPNLPYKVNPFAVERGPQSGYNICNSTTLGPTSQCQTLILNDIVDFCLWGSATPNATVGDTEAAAVAYCTKDTHGTRLIPPGALTSLQFMRTSAYIQIVGTIDQTVLGFTPTDTGGELDPHGADLFGNPLGGLVYSTGLPTGNNATYLQAVNWNNFVGSNMFCFKVCDPTITDPNYCQNRYDLIGCNYNMPSSPLNGTFTSCEGDLQDEVGLYKGADGVTTTWLQPSVIPATLPYQPRIPASSNCVTYQSSNLFSVAAVATPTSSSGGVLTAPAATATVISGRTVAISATGSTPGATAARATSTTGVASGASSLAAGGLVGLATVLSFSLLII